MSGVDISLQNIPIMKDNEAGYRQLGGDDQEDTEETDRSVQQLVEEESIDTPQPNVPADLPSAGLVVSSGEFAAQALENRELHVLKVFFSRSLLFDNFVSEARDLCAAERNFMAWQRTCLYLGLAGGVLLLNIRLPLVGDENTHPREVNNEADVLLVPDVSISGAISFPLGLVFFSMSFIGLALSMLNYIQVVVGYARRHSVVTNNPLTYALVGVAASAILATNILYLIYGGDDSTNG